MTGLKLYRVLISGAGGSVAYVLALNLADLAERYPDPAFVDEQARGETLVITPKVIDLLKQEPS